MFSTEYSLHIFNTIVHKIYNIVKQIAIKTYINQ